MDGARRTTGLTLALLALGACGPALPALEVPAQPLLADLSPAGGFGQVPLDISLDREPDLTLQIRVAHTRKALVFYWFGERTTRTARINLQASGGSSGPGVYEDTVTIRVCADDACQVQVPGSPATVRVLTTVRAGLRAGEPPLPPEAGRLSQ